MRKRSVEVAVQSLGDGEAARLSGSRRGGREGAAGRRRQQRGRGAGRVENAAEPGADAQRGGAGPLIAACKQAVNDGGHSERPACIKRGRQAIAEADIDQGIPPPEDGSAVAENSPQPALAEAGRPSHGRPWRNVVPIPVIIVRPVVDGAAEGEFDLGRHVSGLPAQHQVSPHVKPVAQGARDLCPGYGVGQDGMHLVAILLPWRGRDVPADSPGQSEAGTHPPLVLGVELVFVHSEFPLDRLPDREGGPRAVEVISGGGLGDDAQQVDYRVAIGGSEAAGHSGHGCAARLDTFCKCAGSHVAAHVRQPGGVGAEEME